MSSHTFTHEDVLHNLGRMTQREATLFLCKPNLLILAYQQYNVRLTRERAFYANQLLRSVAKDHSIDEDQLPIDNTIGVTYAIRLHNELCNELGHLPFDEAAHFLRHPTCMLTFLSQFTPLLDLSNHQMEDFNAVLQATIDAKLQN